MLSDLFAQLEESQKELNVSMEKLEETKQNVFAGIDARHNELNEALASLQRTMSGQETVEEKVQRRANYDSNIQKNIGEIDRMLAELMEG